MEKRKLNANVFELESCPEGTTYAAVDRNGFLNFFDYDRMEIKIVSGYTPRGYVKDIEIWRGIGYARHFGIKRTKRGNFDISTFPYGCIIKRPIVQ